MKHPKLLLALVLGVVCAVHSTSISAQERLQLNFQATCLATNDFGDLVKSRVTDKSWVRACVSDLAITNKQSLALAYTVGGDYNGDVIEVVNRDTGAQMCRKLRLLFPMTLSKGDGSEVNQLVYVFGEQQSENVGCGMITRRILRNNRTVVSGTLNFYVLPEGTNGLRLCRASFKTLNPLPLPQ
ncbi:MAG TPA: hypothetical protein VK327_15120 [Candidatus Paceibacterota bacterium]|nr:hypothetical protein [Candidatus Paceibacterota bacterium]